ncbi:ABC transporter substrate-binding protein [Micrococcus lylae]|uniref:ABC transporter substrate-binding protein n=1 Tax=Micrococcus lylae TaxID=1273 RepID=A0ABY2K1Q8_9MICC|nr:ABC transporter substrate-binding protein [Micrococcus lylae]TFH98702.1 ABC transporter substrate-binding protein [Micrococcus lylae]
MRKKRLSIAAAAALLLGLTACGDNGGSSDEIAIGAVHPLSGPLAGVGGMMNDGAELAVDDINAAGGIKSIHGAKLTLMDGDSEGSAAVGQTEARRLVSDGAVALIGTYQSDVTENVAAMAERSDVPLVIDVAIDDKILSHGYKYVFRIQPNASTMGASGAEVLSQIGKATGQDVTKVSYMHIEGAFGESTYQAFRKEAEKQGIQVVRNVSYPATNFSDATTAVTQALSGDPDVLVVSGYYPDNLLIAEAVKAINPNIKAVFGIASGAYDDTSFPSDGGAAANGVLSANYHYSATSKRAQDIRKRFQEKYGRPMETAAMLSYQAVEVIAAGLEKSGSNDPVALQNAIANIRIDDTLLEFKGPIEFDDKGENKNATVIVTQVQKGRIEQVFPEEFATSDLIFPARDH